MLTHWGGRSVWGGYADEDMWKAAMLLCEELRLQHQSQLKQAHQAMRRRCSMSSCIENG